MIHSSRTARAFAVEKSHSVFLVFLAGLSLHVFQNHYYLQRPIADNFPFFFRRILDLSQ